MTVTEVLNFIKAIKPNDYSDAVLCSWLNECEGLVQTEVMLLSVADVISYDPVADASTVLLVPAPHSKLYYAYIGAMIDFANGEYSKYTNSLQLFNQFFVEYSGWYTLKYHPADGNAETEGYYISAYAIAVKHGYTGTEADWVSSLAGAAAGFGTPVASASTLAAGSAATAAVTASGTDTAKVFAFSFGVPKGADGVNGTNFTLLGHYDTLAALEAAVPSPSVGAAYSVGSAAPYDVYIYDGVTSAWVNYGQVIGVSAGFGTPTASAASLPAGSAATAAVTASGSDTEKVFAFSFGLPKGADGTNGTNGTNGVDGVDGQDGAAAGFGVPVASVSTLAAGSAATVAVNASGSDTEKVFAFSFGVPRGADGADGVNGTNGIDGVDGTNGVDGAAAGFDTPTATANTLTAGSAATAAVTTSGGNTAKKFAFTFGIPAGAAGADGVDGTDGVSAGFGTPTASASTLAAGSAATASVTPSGGNTDKVFSFAFGIPRGADGADGSDFTIKGYYASLSALQAAVTSPAAGDAYGVGTASPYEIYIWDGVNSIWIDNGTIQGAKGDTGAAAGFGTPTAAASTLGAGESATAAVAASGTDTSKVFAFTFGIPRGATGATGSAGADGTNGADGADGAAAGFGTPTANANTLTAGSSATAAVSASGDNTSKVFAFTFGIPRGATGAAGANGTNGADGAAAGFGTPTASVSTLAAGSSATASVAASGSDTAKVFAFSFGIPRGATGATGAAGTNGTNGADGAAGPNVVSAETTTALSGILKGNGANVAVAAAGTDYISPDGGTMTGALVAAADTNYTTYKVRNMALSTVAATPTNTGDLLGVYE